MAREQTRPRAVILAAGRASRLGGTNKLLVEAGGQPVHEWHRTALADYEVDVVVRPDDAQAVRDAMPWVRRVVTHGDYDGPGGAVLGYLDRIDQPDELLVLFADTLLREVPSESGDWVGVATPPGRVWDYWDGEWMRGTPAVQVCVGIYNFACMHCLTDTLAHLNERAESEVPFADLLRTYSSEHYLVHKPITGWQDAGDPDAIARVQP